ncbi:MAG TPA: hypothetical protein PKN86_12095 [Candidatus Obscuribacter sp.]|nr:hypothetical protein [Candidatus Obscuribacter sp.]
MKGLKKQRDVLTSNIQQYRNTTAFGSDSDPNVPEKETFVSSFDGQQGFYALSPPFMPSKAEDATLIVYFHGMGSTYMEPYLVPKDKSIAQICRDQLRQGAFLSVDYRGKASWLNQAALADVDAVVLHRDGLVQQRVHVADVVPLHVVLRPSVSDSTPPPGARTST